ncbi:hypothetical protein AVEN_188209-1 [Araneus ventricosus]|uniref:Uncharacterized protein n=1 Tax=Araneus ventricosus TaxID=182803 RepID=A0A4Y2HYL3_ARAVE|nr:hypothetical protein AVEN_188209-1 [Araneus ventricosus]
MENNQACLHSVMEKLDALLRSINPFAESYLQMHQLMQSNPAVNVKMVFMEHPDFDLCRFAVRNADMQCKQCRYVSAPEAMWRLIEFSFAEKPHAGNHKVGRSLTKPTASSKKKCSHNDTSKFDAFKRPVQRAVQQV